MAPPTNTDNMSTILHFHPSRCDIECNAPHPKFYIDRLILNIDPYCLGLHLQDVKRLHMTGSKV